MNMNNYCPFISNVTQHALIQPELIQPSLSSNLILAKQPGKNLNIIGSHELIPNITDRRNSTDAHQQFLYEANFNQIQYKKILTNRTIN